MKAPRAENKLPRIKTIKKITPAWRKQTNKETIQAQNAALRTEHTLRANLPKQTMPWI